MEYLNDEMDELFRKAGEQYPLKTSDSDWDAVLGRLQPAAGNESPFPAQDEKKKNNKRRFLWLLLLLPLGLFSLKYFQAAKKDNLRGSAAASGLTEAQASKNKPADRGATTMPAASVSQKADIAGRENSTAAGSINRPSEKMQPGSSPGRANSGTFPAGNGRTRPAALAALPKQTKAGHQAKSAAVQQGGPQSENGLSAAAAQDVSSDALLNSRSRPVPKTSAGAGENDGATNTNADKTAGAGDTGQPDKSNGAMPKKADSPQPDPAKTEAKDDVKKDSVHAVKKKSKTAAPNEKGIYLSLLAGPDFSSVKLQSVKNMGYSVGLLAGYRFNKHISLEAGIFWDKKQYYSKGEYFNKSKTNIPANYDIRDLDGSCNMFEIPIAVRYDFSYNHKGRFFSTAGFSSYLMKKENYAYTAEYGGSAWPHTASYKNSGNNFLSVLQISGGYEYNWGRIGRIRIEPYLKIPLTGVGIGQLAISSAGLHLGITHSFR